MISFGSSMTRIKRSISFVRRKPVLALSKNSGVRVKLVAYLVGATANKQVFHRHATVIGLEARAASKARLNRTSNVLLVFAQNAQ